jgi:hypothetical protein
MATPTTTEHDPVLDLHTSTRRKVKLDGREYDLRGTSDLRIAEFTKIQSLAMSIAELLTITGERELTKPEEKEFDELLDKAVKMALVASPSVFEKLGQMDRLIVFEAFVMPLTPVLQRWGRMTPATPAGSRSHLTKPAADSRITTEGARSSGPQKRRSG